MEKEKELLISLLNRINYLFDYPEEEKNISEKIIWANQKHGTGTAKKVSKLIDDFKIPKGVGTKLIKIELEKGVDDFQLLNAGLYKLEKREIIYDHHYYLDAFGSKYFILAVPDAFPQRYEHILDSLGIIKNKICKVHIFSDGITRHFLIVGDNGITKYIKSSTDAKWHEMLFSIAKNDSYPYDKSNEPINYSTKHAIYCKGFFTPTKVVTEWTSEGDEKKHKRGEVEIKYVADQDTFKKLRMKLKV